MLQHNQTVFMSIRLAVYWHLHDVVREVDPYSVWQFADDTVRDAVCRAAYGPMARMIKGVSH